MTQAMVTRLLVYGVKEWQMAFGKVLFPVLFQAVLLSGIWILLPDMGRGIPFTAVLSVIFALLITASISFAFAVNLKNEVVVSAFLSFLGLLLCGGVIPRPLLPKGLTLLGDLTPVGVVRGLLSPCFGGGTDAWVFVAALIYLALANGMIWIGIKRIRMGGGA